MKSPQRYPATKLNTLLRTMFCISLLSGAGCSNQYPARHYVELGWDIYVDADIPTGIHALRRCNKSENAGYFSDANSNDRAFCIDKRKAANQKAWAWLNIRPKGKSRLCLDTESYAETRPNGVHELGWRLTDCHQPLGLIVRSHN